MKEYKINNDSKAIPSDEEINRHKDFSKLSHAYQSFTKRPKLPLYKNPKVFIALVLIALLAWLIAEEYSKEESDGKDKTEIQQK